jgi:hypothetical protein
MRPSQARPLKGMETLYRELLLSALRKCAEGSWGLFGIMTTTREIREGG